MVRVLALRELRPRNSGRNGYESSDWLAEALRRCTRRYCSQREQFHLSTYFASISSFTVTLGFAPGGFNFVNSPRQNPKP